MSAKRPGSEEDGSSISFSSDLINSDGTIRLGKLGERSIGTIAYGVILSMIGYIQLIGDGIRAWMSGLAGFLDESIGAVYSGYLSSDGLVGAIEAASTDINVWLDPLGVLAPVVTIAIGLGLGIVVIRVTLAGVEIVLGSNL